MSSHVYITVKIRAVDAKRFVREFKKEYGGESSFSGFVVGKR